MSSINTPLSAQDAEGLISDYINGHLDDEQAQAFAKRIENDPELQNMVELSQDIKQALNSSEEVAIEPDFSAVEAKISSREQRKGIPFGYGASLAMSMCLMLAIVFVVMPPTNNEFETLTNNNTVYAQDTLQLVLHDGNAADQLIAQYDLKVVNAYDNKRILEVEATQRVSELQQELTADPRTLLVKHIPSNQSSASDE